MPKDSLYLLAICFDFGDTLVDEASEIKDETDTTLRGELIPGAGELLHELKRLGYPLALVVDGRPGTYPNVLGQHGLYELFNASAVSEDLGVLKPHPLMFSHALDQLGIAPSDYGRTMMVGNFMARDIKGANDLGMISVWLDWAPRRPKIPADASETPDYTIREPLELLDVVRQIETRDRDRDER
jgi:putative hydrolase of the HAD superfamily